MLDPNAIAQAAEDEHAAHSGPTEAEQYESNVSPTVTASEQVEIGWDDLFGSGIPVELLTRERDGLRKAMEHELGDRAVGPWFATVLVRVETQVTASAAEAAHNNTDPDGGAS